MEQKIRLTRKDKLERYKKEREKGHRLICTSIPPPIGACHKYSAALLPHRKHLCKDYKSWLENREIIVRLYFPPHLIFSSIDMFILRHSQANVKMNCVDNRQMDPRQRTSFCFRFDSWVFVGTHEQHKYCYSIGPSHYQMVVCYSEMTFSDSNQCFV